MDWAHIHIMVNHFPVILAVTGAAAAVLALLRQRRGLWLYATVSLTLAAVTVVPTFFTGEPAEETLHRPWWAVRGSIGQHEQSALISAVLVGLAGLLAAYAWRRLVRYPREVALPGGLRTAVLVTALAAAGSIGYTALLGGRIRHDAPALRGPAPAGVAIPAAGALPLSPPSSPYPPVSQPTTPAPVVP